MIRAWNEAARMEPEKARTVVIGEPNTGFAHLGYSNRRTPSSNFDD